MSTTTTSDKLKKAQSFFNQMASLQMASGKHPRAVELFEMADEQLTEAKKEHTDFLESQLIKH